MEKIMKKVCFATFSEKVKLIKRNFYITVLGLEDGRVNEHRSVLIQKPKSIKRIAFNLYLVEDEDNIYYCLASNDNIHLDRYLAVANELPQKHKRYSLKRLIYHYGGVYEDDICTSEVRSIKKIADNLYKVKTRHTYYCKIV